MIIQAISRQQTGIYSHFRLNLNRLRPLTISRLCSRLIFFFDFFFMISFSNIAFYILTLMAFTDFTWSSGVSFEVFFNAEKCVNHTVTIVVKTMLIYYTE